MKKLLLTALLSVSALLAMNAKDIYKASYAMPHANQTVEDKAEMQNKHIQMQIRSMRNMKCGGNKYENKQQRQSSSKCGTVKIETH